MNDLFSNIWLILGLSCMLAEFLVPGLVLVFVGLGALTTYLFIYLGLIDSVVFQIICFFISSIIYLLVLRTILLSFFPTNTTISNPNEDEVEVGQVVIVEQDVSKDCDGRIQYQDTTWSARSQDGESILKGEKAQIIGRDNITYLIKKIKR